MSAPFRQFTFGSPEETAGFATALAPRLHAGDVLLLEGPIGGGKTHFARALIQARLAADGAPVEDVPSPTFTLVQTYDTGRVEIWHADLYRLNHPHEVEELGLSVAFAEAICLVEWPDRLGTLAPVGALVLSFALGTDAETRIVSASTGDPAWESRLSAVFGGGGDGQ